MKRGTIATLILLDALLFLKVALKQDVILLFLILITQIILGLFLLRFDASYTIGPELSAKKKKGIFLIIALVVPPPLLTHVYNYELSRWQEVGLYLKGPFAILYIIFGAITVFLAAALSVYIRGKYDLD